MGLFKTSYNKDYHVVFYPLASFGRKRKAFKVSPNQLHNYIGRDNANTVLVAASKMRTDRFIKKFRTLGTIYVYLK